MRYWSENLTAIKSPFLAIFCTAARGTENLEKACRQEFSFYCLIEKKKSKTQKGRGLPSMLSAVILEEISKRKWRQSNEREGRSWTMNLRQLWQEEESREGCVYAGPAEL